VILLVIYRRGIWQVQQWTLVPLKLGLQSSVKESRCFRVFLSRLWWVIYPWEQVAALGWQGTISGKHLGHHHCLLGLGFKRMWRTRRGTKTGKLQFEKYVYRVVMAATRYLEISWRPRMPNPLRERMVWAISVSWGLASPKVLEAPVILRKAPVIFTQGDCIGLEWLALYGHLPHFHWPTMIVGVIDLWDVVLNSAQASIQILLASSCNRVWLQRRPCCDPTWWIGQILLYYWKLQSLSVHLILFVLLF